MPSKIIPRWFSWECLRKKYRRQNKPIPSKQRARVIWGDRTLTPEDESTAHQIIQERLTRELKELRGYPDDWDISLDTIAAIVRYDIANINGISYPLGRLSIATKNLALQELVDDIRRGRE